MEVLQVFSARSDKHIAHEQCMVGSGADDSDIDAVSLVPSRETVNNINATSCVQVVDGPFSVDAPNLEVGTTRQQW